MRTTSWLVLTFATGCAGAAPPDLAAWDTEVGATRARVVAYRETLPANSAQVDCERELGRYRGDLEPRVLRLKGMSGGMDGCMRSIGRPGDADASALGGSMGDELERYRAAGCRGSDAAQNRTAGEAHCVGMLDFLDRLGERSRTLNAGSGTMCAR